MDSFMELSPELALLTQQLAHSRHQRARSQVWNSYISMDQVQYGGKPYLNRKFGLATLSKPLM